MSSTTPNCTHSGIVSSLLFCFNFLHNEYHHLTSYMVYLCLWLLSAPAPQPEYKVNFMLCRKINKNIFIYFTIQKKKKGKRFLTHPSLHTFIHTKLYQSFPQCMNESKPHPTLSLLLDLDSPISRDHFLLNICAPYLAFNPNLCLTSLICLCILLFPKYSFYSVNIV